MKTEEATLIKKLFDSGEKLLIYAFPEFFNVNSSWEKIVSMYAGVCIFCYSKSHVYILDRTFVDFNIELKHFRITEEKTSEILFQKGLRL